MEGSRLGSRNAWIAISLVALVLATRIPFRSEYLYHWDSVNLANGMRVFDVAKGQPQVPGYIVYVWLSRLVDVGVDDAQTTMVVISIVASALAVVGLYFLGNSMFGARTGVVAALLLASSPLFWFYGEIALPHALDTAFVVLGVWWLYEVMRGNNRYLYPAIVVLAVAGGVRQQTLLFLFPVLLFSLRRVGWRRFLIAGALGAAVCLAWFAPLIWHTGGLSRYMGISRAYGDYFFRTTSVLHGGGWWGVTRNTLKLSMYTLYGWSVALLPALVYAVARIVRRERVTDWEKLVFVMLWVAPTIAFYLLIHMGQQGLVFLFLPALLLVSAVGLDRLLGSRPRLQAVMVSVLVLLNAAIFCAMPEYPLGRDSVRVLTRAALVASDRYFGDRLEVIEGDFDPASTAVLAASWQHAEYYLPGYTVLRFGLGSKHERDEGMPKGSAVSVVAAPAGFGLQTDNQGQATIVVFDPELMAFSTSPGATSQASLRHGGELDYFVFSAQRPFYYGRQAFGVTEE